MADPGEEVLHYTVDTEPAWFQYRYEYDEEGGHRGPFVDNETATSFSVGPGVTEIGESTFAGCTAITSLRGMGDGVKTIGDEAFSGCTAITTLLGMGKNVAAIEDSAFNASGVASLQGLPETVTVIDEDAFANCTELVSIGPGFPPDCERPPRCLPSLFRSSRRGRVEGLRQHRGMGHVPLVHHLPPPRRPLRDPPSPPPSSHSSSFPAPSQLLSLLANTPDDVVRVILAFMGAEVVAKTDHKDERLELKREKIAVLEAANAEQLEDIAEQARVNAELTRETLKREKARESARKKATETRARCRRNKTHSTLSPLPHSLPPLPPPR